MSNNPISTSAPSIMTQASQSSGMSLALASSSDMRTQPPCAPDTSIVSPGCRRATHSVTTFSPLEVSHKLGLHRTGTTSSATTRNHRGMQGIKRRPNFKARPSINAWASSPGTTSLRSFSPSDKRAQPLCTADTSRTSPVWAVATPHDRVVGRLRTTSCGSWTTQNQQGPPSASNSQSSATAASGMTTKPALRTFSTTCAGTAGTSSLGGRFAHCPDEGGRPSSSRSPPSAA
mmetsp:Transcript_33997/g.72281  ORF Transcript_33997/g.72281 Transcript_33997/m.72281 type:complete len:232 (-) Transcript_33997:176-871(-)